MEIIRRPGYVEINLPELLDPDPRLDNISRVFTAVQPGTHNMLLNLSEYQGLVVEVSNSRIVHSSRTIVSALESMTDTMEQIAVYVRLRHVPIAEAYVMQLERSGFKTRLFTDLNRAAGWLGNR